MKHAALLRVQSIARTHAATITAHFLVAGYAQLKNARMAQKTNRDPAGPGA
jgi:hypothetical protein